MKDPLAEIESQIESLGSRFGDLGRRLIGAGEALANQDAPPSPELFEEIGSARRDFTSLKERVEEQWNKCGLPRGASAACRGLGDMRTLSVSLAGVVKGQLELDRARQAAVETLERFRSVAPVEPVQAVAQESGVRVGGENLVDEMRWRQQRIEHNEAGAGYLGSATTRTTIMPLWKSGEPRPRTF